MKLFKKKLDTEILDWENKFPVQELFSQNGLVIEADHIKHSNKYSKTYVLTSLPKFLNVNGVIKMFQLNDKTLLSKPFDFYIKLNISIKSSNVLIDQQFKAIESGIEVESSIPLVGTSAIKAGKEQENIDQIQQKIANGQELTDTSMFLTIFADSYEDLLEVDKHIQTRFKMRKWSFQAPVAEQKNSFINSLPLPSNNQDKLKILSEPLTTLLLPTSSRSHGVLPLGYDLNRGNVYLWDTFRDGRGHSCTVTGKNGSGKSAFCKKMFEDLGMLGIQRFYIDPEGECDDLAKTIGAKVEHINAFKGINIVDYNESIIDLFDDEDKAKYSPLKDHINWLTEVLLRFKVWPEEFHQDRSRIYQALTDFYNSKGLEKKNRNMRVLCDFIKVNDDKYKIWSYMFNFSKEGTKGEIFANEEDFNLDDDAIIFNTSGNEQPEIRKILGYILLYKTFEKILTKDRYRCLVIDELHMFIEFEGFRNLLIQYIKRARKYNGFYILITQEINDFLKHDCKSILEQSGFDFIFKQSEIESKVIQLSDQLRREIVEMPIGTCIIHQMDKTYTEKVKIHLRDYQFEYSKKKNNQNLSFDTRRRFKVN